MNSGRNALYFLLSLGLATQLVFAQPVLHVLHSFAGGPGGSAPISASTEISPGVFIGAASSVYRLTNGGNFTVISTQNISGALFPASNGSPYGGGSNTPELVDTVNQISRSGVVQLINSSFDTITPQFEEGRNRSLYGFAEIEGQTGLVNGLFQMSFDGTAVSTQAIPSGGLTPQGGAIQQPMAISTALFPTLARD